MRLSERMVSVVGVGGDAGLVTVYGTRLGLVVTHTVGLVPHNV